MKCRKPGKRLNPIVVRGDLLDAERVQRGLRKYDVASLAGVSYTSVWRVLACRPVARSVVERVVRALAFKLDDVLVSPKGEAPPGGYSAEAWLYFRQMLSTKFKRMVQACHSATAEQALKQGWHWPGLESIAARVSLDTNECAGGGDG